MARKPKAKSSSRADDIDKHVGARVRLSRHMVGLSQTALANAVGLSYQQIQRYEQGRNRIGAGRMQLIAAVLNVPISFFYEGAPNQTDQKPELLDHTLEFLASKDGLALSKAFLRLKNPILRRAIVTLVERLED